MKRFLFSILFHVVLRPLIVRNYKLRACGKLPDEWYWADELATNHGFFVNLPAMKPITEEARE